MYRSTGSWLLRQGMTYYSLLTIFPALAALVAVYGLFADPSAVARHLDQVSGVLPGGAIDVAPEQLTRVASNGPQTLERSGRPFFSKYIDLFSASTLICSSR